MKKTITLIFVTLLNLSFVSVATDLVVNNFDDVAPTVSTKYGASYATVSNPVSTPGLNSTANCGKIGRTTGNWWELIYFPVSFTVAPNSTSYVHVLVNYPAEPDISMRVDATTAGSDGGADIRAMNKYTNIGQWQDLVFEVTRAATGLNVIQIIMLADAGFENTPAGLVLNNTDKFGYIDEVIVNSISTPRTSPISAVNNLKSNRMIYSQGKEIVIEPISACKAEIYEITGRMVWKKEINQRVEVKMNKAGVYIVKSGNDVSKVVLY